MVVSTQETIDYGFGQKNNWRRWAINRICERLRRPKEQAVVLYLSGREDIDGALFLQKGFIPRNLISVEREPSIIRSIRQAGRLCIEGDFIDVVNCLLSTGRGPDVIFGDFTSDINPRLLKLAQYWVGKGCANKSVFAFNFLRGRDGRTNGFREFMRAKYSRLNSADLKHRGKIFQLLLIDRIREIIGVENTEWIDDKQLWWFKLIMDSLHFATGTYRNSGKNQTFDSVIFSGATIAGRFDDWNPAIPIQTRRSVSAVLAHRTMRGGFDPLPSADPDTLTRVAAFYP